MKRKTLKLKRKLPKGLTTVTPGVLPGTAVLHHHQSVKQSMNWQSAEASYGLTITVPDNAKAIKAYALRAERLVEDLLTQKFRQHRKLLQNINTETKVD
jgi:hypothetical protein